MAVHDDTSASSQHPPPSVHLIHSSLPSSILLAGPVADYMVFVLAILCFNNFAAALGSNKQPELAHPHESCASEQPCCSTLLIQGRFFSEDFRILLLD